MSVILYASDNEELIEYCDRLLIMYEGRIVAEPGGRTRSTTGPSWHLHAGAAGHGRVEIR